MLNWARVDFYFESATDRGPLADDDERLDVFVHPSPSLRRWRTGSILPVAKRRR
jgi:hypothetical protein